MCECACVCPTINNIQYIQCFCVLSHNFRWFLISFESSLKNIRNSKSRSFLMVRSSVIICVVFVFEVAAKHNKCNACHKIKYKEQDTEQERGTWKGNVIVCQVPKFQLTRLLEFLAVRYPWRQTADFFGLPPFPLPALCPAIIRFGLFIIVFRLSVRFACWERSPVFMVPRYAVFFSGHALLKNKQYVYDVHTAPEWPQRTKNPAPTAHYQQLIFQGKILCWS